MKSLLEFKKYAPVLFTFLFLAALFGSCFFDTRKQDKAEKESQRYDQSLVWIAIIQGDYYRRTNCSISNPPGQVWSGGCWSLGFSRPGYSERWPIRARGVGA